MCYFCIHAIYQRTIEHFVKLTEQLSSSFCCFILRKSKWRRRISISVVTKPYCTPWKSGFDWGRIGDLFLAQIILTGVQHHPAFNSSIISWPTLFSRGEGGRVLMANTRRYLAPKLRMLGDVTSPPPCIFCTSRIPCVGSLLTTKLIFILSLNMTDLYLVIHIDIQAFDWKNCTWNSGNTKTSIIINHDEHCYILSPCTRLCLFWVVITKQLTVRRNTFHVKQHQWSRHVMFRAWHCNILMFPHSGFVVKLKNWCC
jgi:hypothetical protein